MGYIHIINIKPRQLFIFCFLAFLLLISGDIIGQNPCAANPQLLNLPIGAELEPVNERSFSNAFVDLIKQASPFTYTTNSAIVPVDPDGWPTMDFQLSVLSFNDSIIPIYN